MNLFNHDSHPSHSSLFTFHSNSFMVWSSSTIGHDVELLCFVRTFSMVGISLHCAWLSFISLWNWILSYSCGGWARSRHFNDHLQPFRVAGHPAGLCQLWWRPTVCGEKGCRALPNVWDASIDWRNSLPHFQPLFKPQQHPLFPGKSRENERKSIKGKSKRISKRN